MSCPRTGLLVLLVIIGFSAQNVIAQSNVTVVPVEPVHIQPQTVTQVNPDITGILALVGAGLTFLISRMNDQKARGKTNELLDGGLAIANVANKFVNSLKETDYGNQDSARLFNYLVLQLAKNPANAEVLNEKIKTSDMDLLINNKSIIQAAQDNLNQIIRDNKQYYENLIPSSNDTCDNRLVRAVARADKMASKN